MLIHFFNHDSESAALFQGCFRIFQSRDIDHHIKSKVQILVWCQPQTGSYCMEWYWEKFIGLQSTITKTSPIRPTLFKELRKWTCQCSTFPMRWEDFSEVVLVICKINCWSELCKFEHFFKYYDSVPFPDLTFKISTKINWESRKYECLEYPVTIHVSVDGTDCEIQEPSKFNKNWYSHKFNGPGIRYEIGLSIKSGLIVWVNGPYMCGRNPDIKIFKKKMLGCLRSDEFVIADEGYRHGRCIIPSNVIEGASTIHKRVRARHETVNERLKNFNVLHHVFRHNVSLHAVCFHAVSQLTALSIKTTEPLFQLWTVYFSFIKSIIKFDALL